MSGILDKFRNTIISSVFKDSKKTGSINIDDKIALGVILWAVAEADNRILDKETEQIKEVLLKYNSFSEEELSAVLISIKQAAEERVDLYSFTSVLTKDLNYQAKLSILDNLFRVACIDKDLAESELELIRKVSNLFQISHEDFIDSKIKVKKEIGLDSPSF